MVLSIVAFRSLGSRLSILFLITLFSELGMAQRCAQQPDVNPEGWVCTQSGATCSPVTQGGGSTGKCATQGKVPMGRSCQCVGGPTFSLSAWPIRVSVLQGASAQASLYVISSNGFNGSITLSASPLPAGITTSITPNPTNGASALTVSATAGATPGTFPVTITATSGSLTQQISISVAVSPPDFSLVSMLGLNLTWPTYTLAVTTYATSVTVNWPAASVADTAVVSLYGLPSTVTASWTGDSSAPPSSSCNAAPLSSTSTSADCKLLLSVGATTIPGTYVFVVLGQSGPIAHRLYGTLTVGPAAPPPTSATAYRLTVPTTMTAVYAPTYPSIPFAITTGPNWTGKEYTPTCSIMPTFSTSAPAPFCTWSVYGATPPISSWPVPSGGVSYDTFSPYFSGGPGTYTVTINSVDQNGAAPENGAQSFPFVVTPVTNVTARVGSPIAAPVFVNLYWDASWDEDNPAMTQEQLDAFTAALLRISYFSGLTEYGVGTPAYGGGFLPSPGCYQKAPPFVGYYDPVNSSIIGFLQCELDKGGIPQGDSVIYNILLPAGSIESDFAGARKMCTGSNPVAWHFHQTPYSFNGVAALIAAGFDLVLTGGVDGGLSGLLAILGGVSGGPVYTIESADPSCGNVLNSLTHEMVEASSDPFALVDAIFNTNNEIADLCASASSLAPFVPDALNPANAIALGNPPNTFALPSVIMLPRYWSNAQQRCIGGDLTNLPLGPGQNGALTATQSGEGALMQIQVQGVGFGTLPAGFSLPLTNNSPYVAVQNNSEKWQAGNILNDDPFQVNVASWTDTQVLLNGFYSSPAFGNLPLKPNDSLSVWVCNPSSGNCGSGDLVYTGSGTPQLNLFVFNADGVTMNFAVSVDGQNWPLSFSGGYLNTGWHSVGVGPHTVVESAASPGYFKPLYRGLCDASGNITLGIGDNATCTIVNVAEQCSAGTHCCANETSASGCVPGCIPDTQACLPPCESLSSICCAPVLASGRCSEACTAGNKCGANK
jgi:hypothetical protein